MRRVLFVAVVSLAFLAASPSRLRAGEPRTHDRFFLRLSGGGGVANTTIDDATGKLHLDGTSGDLNFAIGAIVAPNLALHFTTWGWLLSDPDGELTIPGVGFGSGTVEGDVDMTAFGAGLTYYFMPANFYLSGSVGAATLEFDSADLGNFETNYGLALDLTVGKEWWVGNSWGLGLNGGFSYHSLPDKELDENWAGTGFALRFSATFN